MDHFRFDSFLSETLERPAYMLAASPTIGQLDTFWCEYTEISTKKDFFASAKVPVESLECVNIIEEVGFRLVDTNMIFDREVAPLAASCSAEIRTVLPKDESQVREIAQSNLVSSRFHLDSAISNKKAALLRANWVGNYFQGQRGDDMLVAEKDGQLQGFLLLLHQRGTLVIDLIAVGDSARRYGVASALISHALDQAGGFNKMIAGTQAANTGAIRFYEALGFRFASAKYVFHAHGGIGANR